MDEVNKGQRHQHSSHVFVLIVGLISGFVGGLAAVRFSPEVFVDSQSINQKVIETEGDIIADLVDEVKASVVSIEVTSSVTSFNPFFGSSSRNQDSAGTGIIISEDGLVLTNKHVLPESLTEVAIELSDGTIYEEAEVIGRDPFSDIAYLKIKDAKDLKAAKLGDSDAVRVGQKVIAIGNALGEFDTTVTSGIISGLGRPIIAGSGSDFEPLSNLFQTDTSINPGNSGGPLLNLDGEVIGVNTAVAGNAENIGFAIPINDIKPGVVSVQENGELIRPYLGVRYITLSPEVSKELEIEQEYGALISTENGIIEDGPADKAGLQPEDIILKVNGQDLSKEMPLPNVVSKFQVGDEITLTVVRDSEELDIVVTLERVPEDL